MILSDIKQAQKYIETNMLNIQEVGFNPKTLEFNNRRYILASGTVLHVVSTDKNFVLKIIKIT